MIYTKVAQLFLTMIILILEQQIGILEWLMEDHVTLKTAEMKLKIQLYITGIN